MAFVFDGVLAIFVQDGPSRAETATFLIRARESKPFHLIEDLRLTDITQFIYTRLAAFSSRKIPAIIYAIFSILCPKLSRNVERKGGES